MFMSRLSPFVLVLSLLGIQELAWADIAVIANRTGKLTRITPGQLSDLYLGRSRSLPDSTSVQVIELTRNSTLRERFFRRINGMTLRQVNAYWARLQFSGQVLPPPALEDETSVLAAIRDNPNAIGYVDAASVDESVRVILTLKDN